MSVKRVQGELTSNNFIYELALKGIDANLTAPYTPQRDSVTKTSNRIIVNDLKAMIKLGNYAKSL